jgi:hypothetical protein
MMDGENDCADLLVQWGKTDGPYSRILEVGSVEGPGIAAVVTEPPPRVKRKPEKVPVEEDENSSDDEDWGMFGSLMADALEVDMEIETEEPKDSGWRDAGWREEESDDSSLGSMLACVLSPDSDEDDVEAEKMMGEREAEASELAEMLAEQESMYEMSRPSFLSMISVRVVYLTVKRFKNNLFKPNTRIVFVTPPSSSRIIPN